MPASVRRLLRGGGHPRSDLGQDLSSKRRRKRDPPRVTLARARSRSHVQRTWGRAVSRGLPLHANPSRRYSNGPSTTVIFLVPAPTRRAFLQRTRFSPPP